ncbi:hypothetical protein AC249_AIPGENE1654 [Exaiptasia diaphana]|nr:hypothetical protein AC249_AIPGENE1654 [Exaiptasia diaphana]
MSSENDKFVQEFRRFLESRGTSSTSSQRFQSASSVASEMRSDATLAQNVAQVFQNTRDGVQSGIWTNPPQLPTLSQPAAGRQVGRGRKRKAQKSYSIKLVIVDYLKEVAETGITNNFRSTPLMEAPLTVFENEQDASIRKKVLSMIKSRYSAYDGDYYYASRSGKKTNLNLMPRQNLTGKELNTLKAKSTNSLYVMLKKPANGNEEPDEEEDERDEYENETTDTGLLTFEVPAKRNQRTQSTNRDLGFEFRQNYLRTVTENADSSDEDTSSCDGEGTSGEDSRGRNPSNQPIKKPFTGHSGVQFKEGNAFIPTVMIMGIFQIYQLRGVNDIRVVRLYKDLMSLLKITSAGFKDPNEILQKLLATLLDEEDHRMIKIPIAIPHLDLLKPEDECIHSIDTEDNSSLLYGMVVHSRRRSHFYTVLRLEMSSDTWIVYDDLKTYEVEMTDTLLNDLGGGEHRDLSSILISKPSKCCGELVFKT